MARASGISASAVRRIWKAHGLQPHRYRQFKLSSDPNFVAKLRDVVGLYDRKIRVLTIVDTFSRFSPAVHPRFSYRGEDVVLTLERNCKTVRYPKTIRVDRGSEFVSRDLDVWAYQEANT